MRHLLEINFVFFLLQTSNGNVTVSIEPLKQVRLKNNSVSFQCIADIVPSQAINFLWKRNGSFIDTSINDRVILTNDGRFTIKRIRLEDFNSYQCVAQFGNSAVISQSANLEREYFILGNIANKTSVVKKEGTSVLLKVPDVQSNPKASFMWKIYDQKRNDKAFDQQRYFVTANGDLLISPVIWLKDNGCTAKLFINWKYSDVRQFEYGLTVTDRIPEDRDNPCYGLQPTFIQTIKNFTAGEGTNFTLGCLPVRQRCKEPTPIQWHYRGRPVGNSRQLRLVNVQKSDEGVYMCIAFGKPATVTATHTTTVVVIERPRLIIEPPAIVKVGPNGIIPAGKASGVDKIEWFINSYKIPIVSSLYEIFENNSLRMKFLREDLSGTYQIFYHNKAGFITRAIQVYVTQKSRECGRKIANKIRFSISPSHLKPNVTSKCTWIIQTKSTKKIQLRLMKYTMNAGCNETSLRIHDGYFEETATRRHIFCSAATLQSIIDVRGPSILVELYYHDSQPKNAGFELIYGYNLSAVSTTISSIHSKVAYNSTKPTTAATVKPRTATYKVTKTIHNSAKAVTSPITLRKSTYTTLATTKRTLEPNDRDERHAEGSKASTVIAVSVSSGCLVVIVTGIAILCCRKRHSNMASRLQSSKELTSFQMQPNAKAKIKIAQSKASHSLSDASAEKTHFSKTGKHSNCMEHQLAAKGGLSQELGHNGPCTDDNNYTPLLRTSDDSAPQSYMPLRFEKNGHAHKPSECDYEVVDTVASVRHKDDATKGTHGNQLKNVNVDSQKQIYDDVAPEPMYLVLKDEEPSQLNKVVPVCQEVTSQPRKEGYLTSNLPMTTLKNDDGAPEPMHRLLKEEASSRLIENTPVLERCVSQSSTDGYLVPAVPMNKQSIDQATQEPMYIEIKEVDPTKLTTATPVSRASSLQTSTDDYLVPNLSTSMQKKGKNHEVRILHTADVVYSSADYVDPNPVNPDHVIPVCMASQQL